MYGTLETLQFNNGSHVSNFISYKWFMWFQIRNTHSSWLRKKILFITMILGSFIGHKSVLRHKLDLRIEGVWETLGICFLSLTSTSLCISASSSSQSTNRYQLLFRPSDGKWALQGNGHHVYGIRHWRNTNPLLFSLEL